MIQPIHAHLKNVPCSACHTLTTNIFTKLLCTNVWEIKPIEKLCVITLVLTTLDTVFSLYEWYNVTGPVTGVLDGSFIVYSRVLAISCLI